MVTPNSVLTDNLNGTFITYNGNEFCLQNDKGNFAVSGLSEGYEPIGAKEYNGVIYIVSVKNAFAVDETTGEYITDENGNYKIDPSNCLTEIGTYPGLDWSIDKETENVFCYKDGEPEGRLAYTPLGNYKAINSENYGAFTNVPLGYSTLTPVTIEIQPSYDGSVNLILTDGVNPVRMINSAFSALPNDKYKLISRRGEDPINYYESDRLDVLNLVRNCRTLSNVELMEVISGGQLKGGNYTLYIKFGDDDFNQTDVAAESSIISIFNGNDCTPYTISGTLLDERTDKKIHITVTNVDTQYSKIYVYYSREYSDTLGYRLTEYGVFKEPFSIKNQNDVDIWLTGFEQTETINSEEINIDYHTVDFARAEAQQQSMLFLGNVGQKETFQLYERLDIAAKSIVTTVNQSYLGQVSFDYNKNGSHNSENSEYYSTKNIYDKLGYWPNEWYRFGIVFILNDGSTTPVFNMRGGKFNSLGTQSDNSNEYGVFKTPDIPILTSTQVKPLYFEFKITSDLPKEVSGYFYVRQKRIPTTICQGLRLGVDGRSHLPITYNGKRWFTQSFLALKRWKIKDEDDSPAYKDNNAGLMPKLEYYNKSIDDLNEQNLFEEKYILYDQGYNPETYGLLSLDPAVVASVRNILDGSEFEVFEEYNTNTRFGSTVQQYPGLSNNPNGKFLQVWEEINSKRNSSSQTLQCVFIPSNTKVKTINNNSFSTVAGNANDISQYSYCDKTKGVKRKYKPKRKTENDNHYYSGDLGNQFNTVEEYTRAVSNESDFAEFGFNSILNVNIIRGIFTPFIGISSNNTNQSLQNQSIYSIRIKESESAEKIRELDESPFYTVSNRFPITVLNSSIYRGDCYTSTVSMRILQNYIDPNAPVSDNIVDFDNWSVFVRAAGDYRDDDDTDKLTSERLKQGYPDWNEVNSADVNTVDLGYWVTFKCLSSYNLGLRSIDRSDEQQMSLIGNAKSFYPINGGSTSTGNKVGESFLLNDGYSATVGEKVYNLFDPDLPYTQSEFANRIIFSNVQVDNSYTNGYRTFQGLSYQDYDKQYGAITKLVPWDNNLLVVMEHGIGVVGVNEQALMQTNTADTIHIYGHSVLSDHMQIISPDYGSKYEHSVIRTPIGVYGIDTDARKIWRISTPKGFETLSDMKIESYLNDELGTNKSIDLPLVDIRTHYNATKGDIMFTFFKKLFKKNNKKVEPRTTVKSTEQKYFNISTAEQTLSQDQTISMSFSTNLSRSEVEASINNSDIAEIELDFENKKLKIHGLEAGGASVDIAGKEIPIRVKTEEEEEAEKQKETAEITGTQIVTETVTETDPETGDEVEIEQTVVKTRTTILPPVHDWTFYLGETYVLPIEFKNNSSGLTLQDCEVTVKYSDGGSAEVVKEGNNLKITPLTNGKLRFGVSHPNAKGFDTAWIDLETRIFWINLNGTHVDGDTVDVSAPVGSYFELTAYGNNYGSVTIDGFDTSIVSGGVTETTSRIWFFGNKVGDTTAIITDTGSNDSITVNLHVVACVNITDAEFYSNNTQITELTMHVGETKRITWKYIPEYHPGNTNVLSAGLRLDKPTVYDKTRPTELQVANASYSLGSCYSNITARQAGTIVWTVFISPAGGGKVTYVDLPITVIDE